MNPSQEARAYSLQAAMKRCRTAGLMITSDRGVLFIADREHPMDRVSLDGLSDKEVHEQQHEWMVANTRQLTMFPDDETEAGNSPPKAY